MDKIILRAVTIYNLSSEEEYYIDDSGQLRARGFLYDEFTGIYIDQFGELQQIPLSLVKEQHAVREMLGLIEKQTTEAFVDFRKKSTLKAVVA